RLPMLEQLLAKAGRSVMAIADAGTIAGESWSLGYGDCRCWNNCWRKLVARLWRLSMLDIKKGKHISTLAITFFSQTKS
ncbi:MAG: hypothetical protein ACPG45_10715, partial [Flavobacteriaceae bacterium]